MKIKSSQSVMLKYLPLYGKAALLTAKIGFLLAFFSDKNPFGYVDENGDYQGYDVYQIFHFKNMMPMQQQKMHLDTIAPAVTKGNVTLLDWVNEEIRALGKEKFFHADYEATLIDTYGSDYEDSLVVEGGQAD